VLRLRQRPRTRTSGPGHRSGLDARGLNKLEIYRKFDVREVWYWRRGRITVHALRGESYAEIPASEVLPGIDLVKLASFLDRPTTSQAIREYRACLQA
jgi:hypothetical protein